MPITMAASVQMLLGRRKVMDYSGAFECRDTFMQRAADEAREVVTDGLRPNGDWDDRMILNFLHNYGMGININTSVRFSPPPADDVEGRYGDYSVQDVIDTVRLVLPQATFETTEYVDIFTKRRHIGMSCRGHMGIGLAGMYWLITANRAARYSPNGWDGMRDLLEALPPEDRRMWYQPEDYDLHIAELDALKGGKGNPPYIWMLYEGVGPITLRTKTVEYDGIIENDAWGNYYIGADFAEML